MTSKNITQPDDWWEAFTARANELGIGLSELLGEGGRKMLSPEQRKALSERKPAHRPKKEESE
jgi:hypothetical protein